MLLTPDERPALSAFYFASWHCNDLLQSLSHVKRIGRHDFLASAFTGSGKSDAQRYEQCAHHLAAFLVFRTAAYLLPILKTLHEAPSAATMQGMSKSWCGWRCPDLFQAPVSPATTRRRTHPETQTTFSCLRALDLVRNRKDNSRSARSSARWQFSGRCGIMFWEPHVTSRSNRA